MRSQPCPCERAILRVRASAHALILLVALVAAGCSSTLGTHVAGVDNFGVVTTGSRPIYRGAQPSERGIETLRAMGVRTIVDLRNDADPREPAWAAVAGMRYVRIPSACEDPRAADVQSFLRMMEGQPSPPRVDQPVAFPVFVHCKAGRDRTGLFVAAYRIVEEHWSNERAEREMKQYGHLHLICPRVDPFVLHLDPSLYAAPRGK